MKYIILTAFLALAPITTNAQFLFRISGNGLEKPSYMLGTIHYLSGSVLDSIADYQNAEAQCLQMYVEVVPKPSMMLGVKNNQPQETERQSATYPDGKHIFNVIDTESANILKEKFKEAMNVNLKDPKMKSFWDWTPAVFHNLLASRMRNYIMPRGGGMDGMLIMKAKKRGWEVGELDDEHFKPNDLAGKPRKQPQTIEEQADSLMAFLKNYEQLKQQIVESFNSFCNYWMMGDFEGFARVEIAEVNQQTAMFKERNEKWLPKILTAIREKPTMFVFGAGHLLGDHGIIQLLRNAGYEVEQVKK